MTNVYPNTELHIAGKWTSAAAGETIDVLNPATEEPIGNVAHARIPDLDAALDVTLGVGVGLSVTLAQRLGTSTAVMSSKLLFAQAQS